MFLRKTVFVCLAIIGISLVAVSVAEAQRFNLMSEGGGNNADTWITCSKCKQRYRYGTHHSCPPKPPSESDTEKIAKIIGGFVNEASQWTTCRNCGQRYRQDQFHRCPPQPRWIRCQNCGAQYQEGQFHRCPQPKPQPQPQPQKPTVTTGNPLPPEKPSVGTGNATAVKPANFNLGNIKAIQDSILDPIMDKKIDDISKNLDDSQIAITIGSIDFQPPLTPQDNIKLMDAIRDGDSQKVMDILNNGGYATTGQDNSTLIGLADAKNLVNTYNNGGSISPFDLKNVLHTLNNGDKTMLGGLVTNLQTFGVINKIGKILDFAGTLLSGGGTLGGGSIPTGIVPIVLFPDLPYGVIFPLGNGVYGVGTGGAGSIGIYQGHLPQPPIYDGGRITQTEGGANRLILYNETDEEVKHSVNGSDIYTVDKNGGWQNWWDLPNQIRVRLPSGKSGSWTTVNVKPGTYEFVKTSNGGWKLEAQKTEVTIKNTDNPVPFTFFIGDEKYVIEPNGSLTLNDPKGGNSVYEIHFARSSDKEDVATHAVGGKLNFVVGRDQSDGKWSLFWEGTEPVKPPAPKQGISSLGSTLTYDDSTISSSNFSGLPVLPSYE